MSARQRRTTGAMTLTRAGDVAYFGVAKRLGAELDRRFELVVEHEKVSLCSSDCLLCENDHRRWVACE